MSVNLKAQIPIFEHHNWDWQNDRYSIDELHSDINEISIQFKSWNHKREKNTKYCLEVKSIKDEGKLLVASYFIGCDWLIKEKQSVIVRPKLDKDRDNNANQNENVNYLEMMKIAISQPEAIEHAGSLFEIKPEEPFIEIDRADDYLTPFLVLYYVQLLKKIACKGLKKGYYAVEKNLNGRIKGKILVGATLRNNTFKGRTLNTRCFYNEFGINCIENRYLKKALIFGQHYLYTTRFLKENNADNGWSQTVNYLNAAFEQVADEADTHSLISFHKNIFYKEYEETLKIARIILQRFGYNFIKTQEGSRTMVPPFWIDMSKLFEMYALSSLRVIFSGAEIEYQKQKGYDKPDYLIRSTYPKYQYVVDAKYKLAYCNDNFLTAAQIDDIRQVSAYARNIQAKEWLGVQGISDEIECMIIYPNPNSEIDISENKQIPIKQYSGIYKIGIKLPLFKLKKSSITHSALH